MNYFNQTIQIKYARWIVILFLVSFVSCSLWKKKVEPQDVPPWSTIIKLYQQDWKSKQSAFTEHDATLRTFAPPLATLILAEARREHLGKLKVNPLYHSNNPNVRNLNIAKPMYSAVDHATSKVTFINLNEPVKIYVDVIMLDTGDWRITNIRYPDGTDLISILIN